MNTLESCIILSPSSIEEECAKFIIEETLSPFVLHNITTAGEQYTLSLWVKSDNGGSIVSRGKTMPTTNEWAKYTVTFTTNDTDVSIFFNTIDTYYIYHPQLETGSKATDWTEAPEDLIERVEKAQDTANEADTTSKDNANRLNNAESIIKQIEESISMLVTDTNGTSLMTQTAEGNWTFSMSQTQQTIEQISVYLKDLEEELGSIDFVVESLRGDLDKAETSLEWVKIDTYQDEPCIIMAETDSDFKVIITNTRMVYYSDSLGELASFTNQALTVKKAIIEEELQQGPFVWKVRSNGNMGLLWRGVTS